MSTERWTQIVSHGEIVLEEEMALDANVGECIDYEGYRYTVTGRSWDYASISFRFCLVLILRCTKRKIKE